MKKKRMGEISARGKASTGDKSSKWQTDGPYVQANWPASKIIGENIPEAAKQEAI